MDGMINIRKEKGFTSHDVVAKMRGILKQKKIGHTGTLDPEAEGVLPVALGAATKLCELFSDRSKTYSAVIRLGISTDTEDMTGNVLETDELWQNLTDEQITATVMSFKGDYMQVPPMYSALKVNGRKLYEYARAGQTIERQARPLTIYDIKVLWIKLPELAVEVSCSKGTYIRTLSKDIGEKLGVHACMQSLLRTRVGDFKLEDSITLSELENIVKNGDIASYVSDISRMFDFLPGYVVNETGAKQLSNGNPIDYIYADECHIGHGECSVLGDWTDCVSIYNWNREFIGIYKRLDDKKVFHPVKLFFINNGGVGSDKGK